MSLLPVSREVEDVCVSTAAETTNNMKTNRKSTVKQSNRLAAYLATGIGAGLGTVMKQKSHFRLRLSA